jgi:hypothetical protein
MMHLRFIQKVLIIITFIAVPSYKINGTTLDLKYAWAIGFLTFIILSVSLSLELIMKPYRVNSILIISQILGWTNVINAFFSWMRAFNVQNIFLVDSNLSIIMLVINWGSLVLSVFFCLLWFFLFQTKWPINDKIIEELKSTFSHYIKAIKDGHLLYEYAQNTHPIFIRCDLIEKHRNILATYYFEAIEEQNPLENSLEDILMKLEEEYFINHPYTILPHKKLQEVLGQLKADMDIRQYKLILIPIHYRIILMKILAYRAFCDLLIRIREKNRRQAQEEFMSEDYQIEND